MYVAVHYIQPNPTGELYSPGEIIHEAMRDDVVKHYLSKGAIKEIAPYAHDVEPAAAEPVNDEAVGHEDDGEAEPVQEAETEPADDMAEDHDDEYADDAEPMMIDPTAVMKTDAAPKKRSSRKGGNA